MRRYVKYLFFFSIIYICTCVIHIFYANGPSNNERDTRKIQVIARYECERYGHDHLPRSLKKLKIADKFGRDKPYGSKPYTKKEFENKKVFFAS